MGASPEIKEHAVERAVKIFGLLKQAAARNEPCPKNTALAARFGCGTATVVNAFAFLEANGMIEVARGQCNRVVTICSTGERTAGRLRETHHTRRAA